MTKLEPLVNFYADACRMQIHRGHGTSWIAAHPGQLQADFDLLRSGARIRPPRLRIDKYQRRKKSLQKYLWIAIGGSLGALARYGVGATIANRMGSRLPYGTFVVNISACLILGFSLALLGRHADVNPAWGYMISTGFVGAYSTFSAFEWETFSSLQAGSFLVAAVYIATSIFFGLVAIWCGTLVAKGIS